jgi:hypothetical protein
VIVEVESKLMELGGNAARVVCGARERKPI